MEDWLKTHAVFVTAIAGAIYLAEGSSAALAGRPEAVRTLVRGVRQGFSALSAAGVVIEPRRLGMLFALPSVIAEVLLAQVSGPSGRGADLRRTCSSGSR